MIVGRSLIYKRVYVDKEDGTPKVQALKDKGYEVVELGGRPVAYRWTNGTGWARRAPASCEVVRMKAVNHKPVNRPKGTPTLQGGEEVRKVQ